MGRTSREKEDEDDSGSNGDEAFKLLSLVPSSQTLQAGEKTTYNKEPLPTVQASNAFHMQDSIRNIIAESLHSHIAKEEDREALRSLVVFVPSRNGIKRSRNETGLARALEKSGSQVWTETVLESLKRCNETPTNDLATQPNGRSNTIEDHI